MISTPNRCRAVELVEEAMAQGARQEKACALLGISARTYQRWTREGGVEPDRRAEAPRPVPANRLSEAERERILEVCNQPEYASLPPSQIVPMLVDQGEYIASESTFYRVLREAGLLVPDGDEEAFREALARLLTSSQLRKHYAERGRERAKYYSPERIIPKWEALLEQVMASS